MQIKKVLVIKGGSQYGQTRYEADEMIKGFIEQNCKVSIMDLMSDETNYTDGWVEGYDLILGFNAMGIEWYMADKTANKPLFWAFLVDHPFYHHLRLLKIKGNVIVSCIDRKHVEYIDRYYKNIKWVCFMPHGGIIGKSHYIPYENRKYNVVMMGGLGKITETLVSINELKNRIGEVVDPVLHQVEKDMNLDLESVLEDQLRKNGVAITDQEFSAFMHGLYPIDIMRRYIKRRDLIDAITSAGIEVDIWGNGWEKVAEKNDKIRLHEPVAYDMINSIMADAKIVLNDMPLFHDGSHERVFAPMQCGAVCLSDKSIFIEELFVDKRDIVFYDSQKLEEVPCLIDYLLNNQKEAKLIAENGMVASQNETWVRRSYEVFEVAESLQS